MNTILKLFRNWREQTNRSYVQFRNEIVDLLESVFSRRAFLPSIRFPGLPYAVEASFLGLFAALDFFTDIVSVVPFQAAAQTILDELTIDRKLGQKVMTLNSAALLVSKVIVERGIGTVQNPTPTEWQVFSTSQRLAKLENLIKERTLRNTFKFLFGSLWTRIVRLALLVVTFIKMLTLLALLWNWQKLISEPTNWKTLFSAALRQDNPRVTMLVTLNRRAGGVPP